MTSALLVGYGCSTDDGLKMVDGLEAWVFAFCGQHPEIPLGCGEDVLYIALASTDEEQAHMLGVVKLPDEGALSLKHITAWVPQEHLDRVCEWWELVRREAGEAGLMIPVGRLSFLSTVEVEQEEENEMNGGR